MTTLATAAAEAPISVPFENDRLAGILTRPVADSRRVGVIVFHGGGDFNLPSHRNRWTVQLARRLAGDGYSVIRFGYRGVGDSTGRLDPHTPERPLVDQGRAVAGYLLETGEVEGLIFLGSCFGGRNVLATAASLPEATGVLVASMPVADQRQRHAHEQSPGSLARRALGPEGREALRRPGRRRRYARMAVSMARVQLQRLAGVTGNDPAPWVSAKVTEPLARLAERRVPVRLVYGRDDEFYPDFELARSGRLGRIIEEGGFEVDTSYPARLHGFPTVAAQQHLIEQTLAFMAHLDARL